MVHFGRLDLSQMTGNSFSSKKSTIDTMNNNTLEIAKNLIARQSLTPEDAGCQKLIQELLKDSQFEFEEMNFILL